MSEFVLDCSVVMAWHFEDESNTYADAVLEALKSQRAWVPPLFFYEVANSLLVARRRNRTTDLKADALFAELLVLPVDLEKKSPAETIPSILALARSHGLTAYDAAYLELAQRLNIPLATLDKRLCEAATSLGVSLLV